MILPVIALAVCAVMARGGRHPRLLRGAIAYFVASVLILAAILAYPSSRMTAAEANGIPIFVGLVVGLVPWGRVAAFRWPPLGARAPGVRVGAGSKLCPDCAETVKAEARLCRYCRHVFAEAPASPAPAAPLGELWPAGGDAPEAVTAGVAPPAEKTRPAAPRRAPSTRLLLAGGALAIMAATALGVAELGTAGAGAAPNDCGGRPFQCTVDARGVITSVNGIACPTHLTIALWSHETTDTNYRGSPCGFEVKAGIALLEHETGILWTQVALPTKSGLGTQP